jgi:hypothetical protein
MLLWFRVLVMLRFFSPAPVFLAFPPPPLLLLFALNLPCKQAHAADALSGMVLPICFFFLLFSDTCRLNSQWHFFGWLH